MTNSRSPWPVALVAGLLGAGVAVLVVALLGVGGGSTTTVVRSAPLDTGGSTSPVNAKSGGLSARDIYKRDSNSVVYITAQVQKTSSEFGFPQQQNGVASGSGFIIDKEGRLLTNAHVVDGATKVTVKFRDDKTAEAKILGRDRSSDLALLKVDPKGLDLQPVELGSARDVQVGDPVVAIGNPFGQPWTLTTGVVSAKDRSITGLNGFSIDKVIQTDAAINPGNSGGPLIDGAGEVVGINSQIETGNSGSGGNVGIGFAIPIDTARRLLPQLEKGTITTGYMGITGGTVDENLKSLNLPVDQGVLVQSVVPKGPAAQAGIKGGDVSAQLNGAQITLGGDIIVKLDGKPVKTSEDLAAYVSSKRKGDKIKVTFLREGKEKTVTVTLAERPQGQVGGSQDQGQAPSP